MPVTGFAFGTIREVGDGYVTIRPHQRQALTRGHDAIPAMVQGQAFVPGDVVVFDVERFDVAPFIGARAVALVALVDGEEEVCE